MPLDGGALTLRWMRAPARGLAVAPPAPSPPVAVSLARVREERGVGDGEVRNELGFG
jgi:hypothetical protein